MKFFEKFLLQNKNHVNCQFYRYDQNNWGKGDMWVRPETFDIQTLGNPSFDNKETSSQIRQKDVSILFIRWG